MLIFAKQISTSVVKPLKINLFKTSSPQKHYFSSTHNHTMMKAYLITTIITIGSFCLFGQITDEQRKSYSEKIINERYDAAIKEMQKLIQANPEDFDLCLEIGDVFERTQMYDSSLYYFDKAIKIDPDHPEPYNRKGIIFCNAGFYDEAYDLFTEAIERADDEIKYTYYPNRATTFSSRRNFQKAYEDLMVAYKHIPEDLAVLNNLSSICNELGKNEEAIQYLYDVLEIDSMFIGAYVNLGFIYQEDGKHNEAIPLFTKAIEMDPDEGISYNNRAYSYLQIGEVKKAMKDVKKSIDLYPSNSYAYRNQALIYLEMKGKEDEACESLNKAYQLGFVEMYGDEILELFKKHCK